MNPPQLQMEARLRKGMRTLALLRQAHRQIAAARAQGRGDPPVLVVMLAQMGDVVMGLGVTAALRKRHPKSPLCFACRPEWVALPKTDPLLDGTLGAQSLFEVRALARLFAVVYVLDIPIPDLLGYLDGVPGVFRYAPPTTADWFHPGRHLIDLYAQNAGLPDGSVLPRALWTPADLPVLTPYSGPTIALHARSSMAAKNWPLSCWADLVTRWAARSARFVLIGGASEGAELALLPNVVDLTGRLSLPQTAALVASCDAFLGPDSGPAYIAWAVGTRTLTLFGATVPETTGPRGLGHFHIRAPNACVPACHRICVRTPLCIDALTVDAVSDALECVLGA